MGGWGLTVVAAACGPGARAQQCPPHISSRLSGKVSAHWLVKVETE